MKNGTCRHTIQYNDHYILQPPELDFVLGLLQTQGKGARTMAERCNKCLHCLRPNMHKACLRPLVRAAPDTSDNFGTTSKCVPMPFYSSSSTQALSRKPPTLHLVKKGLNYDTCSGCIPQLRHHIQLVIWASLQSA